MLSPAPPERKVGSSSGPGGLAESSVSDLEKLLAMARRQAVVLALGCALGLFGGVAYVATAIPQYVATSYVLIDDRSVRAVQDLLPTATLAPQDSAIESQVELLRSEQIGMAVVDKLGLDRSEAFLLEKQSPAEMLLDRLDFRTWFAPPPVTTNEAVVSKKQALQKLLGGLTIRRVGRAYVLSISYMSDDRDLAATIANGFADVYLIDQLESKYESTRRASGWLQERIRELRDQSREAELAVQRFRSQNNLLSAGGRLISDQQLSEINSQLITARAETARTRARYERIRSIIDSHQTDAVVTEALEQPVFSDLRSKYLDRAKRAADLAERFGPTHVQVMSLRNEMKEYERLIFEELGRIAESYRSDYEVAQSRENSLDSSLKAAMGVTSEANTTLVALRELEQQAETYRDLQKNFMARFEEAVQKQSFPITDARIITRASPPGGPSLPQRNRSVLTGLLLGALAGVGVGLLREKNDRVFRNSAQIRDEIGADFLGILPRLSVAEGAKGHEKAPAPADAREFIAPERMRIALDKPLSVYSETLRTIKTAADISLKGELSFIIGVISMFPGEGKSMTAKNLATLIASQGARTLLIDADLRSPRLTSNLGRKGKPGLIDLLVGDGALTDHLSLERDSGLAFLSSGSNAPPGLTSDLLASARMAALLREAGESFRYVIVDLPPIAPVVDVKAAADQFSAFVFIAEWGKTPRRAVKNAFETETRIRERCLGIVLNKVSEEQIRLYESYGSRYYYRYGDSDPEPGAPAS